MGQIASDNVNNLSYFSTKEPITKPVIQNTYSMDSYNSSRTYVMFSMGNIITIIYYYYSLLFFKIYIYFYNFF